jgi:hypothetical protein
MAQTAGPCLHYRGFLSALAIATEISDQIIPGEVGDKTSPRILLFLTRFLSQRHSHSSRLRRQGLLRPRTSARRSESVFVEKGSANGQGSVLVTLAVVVYAIPGVIIKVVGYGSWSPPSEALSE